MPSLNRPWQETPIPGDPSASILVSPTTMGMGSENTIHPAKLMRQNASPFFCVVREPNSTYRLLNPEGETRSYEIHRLVMEPYHSQEASGILPYLGLYPRVNEHMVQSGSVHAVNRCDAILENCIPAIESLQATHPILFNEVLFKLLQCLINGLSRLTKYNVVHHDINPKNIGLRKHKWWIFDFGAAQFYEEFQNSTFPRGTPLYNSPEVLAQDKRFPYAQDIWSIGLILKRLLGQPIEFNDRSEIYKKLREESEANPHQERLQQALLNQLLQQTTFKSIVEWLSESMTHPLPEYRPSLATLNALIVHASQLLAPFHSEDEEAFYESLIQANVTTANSPASHESSVVEVFNIENNAPSGVSSPTVPHPPDDVQSDEILNTHLFLSSP